MVSVGQKRRQLTIHNIAIALGKWKSQTQTGRELGHGHKLGSGGHGLLPIVTVVQLQDQLLHVCSVLHFVTLQSYLGKGVGTFLINDPLHEIASCIIHYLCPDSSRLPQHYFSLSYASNNALYDLQQLAIGCDDYNLQLISTLRSLQQHHLTKPLQLVQGFIACI